MQQRMAAFYDNLLPLASAAGTDIEKLKAEATELKKYTEAYMASQFTLQLISTAALVGVFLLTLKAHQRKR